MSLPREVIYEHEEQLIRTPPLRELSQLRSDQPLFEMSNIQFDFNHPITLNEAKSTQFELEMFWKMQWRDESEVEVSPDGDNGEPESQLNFAPDPNEKEGQSTCSIQIKVRESEKYSSRIEVKRVLDASGRETSTLIVDTSQAGNDDYYC